MATVIDVHTAESERPVRRPYFSAIRWSAIFAGVVSGTASYLLLTLLGLAVGLTAVDPASAEPVGRVPVATGIWTGISLLISAFIGGYVAARMSGLSRASDGMLHGFVSWGATTLLYVFLTTSALGAILGGTFRIVGEVAQTGAQVGAQAAGGSQNIMNMITGGSANADPQTLRDIQQAMRSGNRDQAVNLMVQRMGMSQETANQTADRVMPLLSQQGGANVRETATRATETATRASWWLVIGLALSLVLGILGGGSGVRAVSRRLDGDYSAKRHIRGSAV